jgi:hypothetical protein
MTLTLPPELWIMVQDALPPASATHSRKLCRLLAGFPRFLQELPLVLDMLEILVVELNDLDTLRWLVRHTHQITYQLLVDMACFGNLDMWMWADAYFEFTLEELREDAPLGRVTPFQEAATGHLPLLQWFYDTYHFTREDVTANNHYMLQMASQGGHLHILRWLHQTFGFTLEDLVWDDSYAVFLAIITGQLAVVQWMLATFPLTKEHILVRRESLLHLLSCTSEVDAEHVFRLLVQHFQLTVDDFQDVLYPENERLGFHQHLLSVLPSLP